MQREKQQVRRSGSSRKEEKMKILGWFLGVFIFGFLA